METNKEPEVRRKRGRPPLNKSLNGMPPKYHLKALQQPIAPKEAITPTEQQSPSVEAKESGLEVTVPATPQMKQAFEEYHAEQKEVCETVCNEIKQYYESPRDIRQNPMADLTPVEAIEFTNGKNKLKILLSKKHNRMYRVQIFLNDSVEIRPATYTGFAPASTFWGFLKEITK